MPVERNTRDAARGANAYYALARVLDLPTEWAGDLASVLRTHLGSLTEKLDTAAAEAATEMVAACDERDAAVVAYTKLFIGPFEILAPPYACMYLDPEQRLMGPVSQNVARTYAEAGLAPGSRVREAPDHVSHELEFMYWLAFQESVTSDRVWRTRQERFWTRHLGLWLPAFADSVMEADVHPYYTSLSRLLRAFCEWEEQSFVPATGQAPLNDQRPGDGRPANGKRGAG
jgi:TorA maturation chaperone TorD